MNKFAQPQCYPADLFLSGIHKSERAKLLKKPWSIADVMREKRAAEKRKEIVERFRVKWRKK